MFWIAADIVKIMLVCMKRNGNIGASTTYYTLKLFLLDGMLWMVNSRFLDCLRLLNEMCMVLHALYSILCVYILFNLNRMSPKLLAFKMLNLKLYIFSYIRPAVFVFWHIQFAKVIFSASLLMQPERFWNDWKSVFLILVVCLWK